MYHNIGIDNKYHNNDNNNEKNNNIDDIDNKIVLYY